MRHLWEIQMDEKVARVLNGFIALSDAQKEQLIGALNEFRRGNDLVKRQLRESVTASVTKMQTGPHGGGCPCCGR